MVQNFQRIFSNFPIICHHLKRCPFVIIYIVGGVCDITHKDSLTKKISYIWRSGEELQARARTLDGTPVSIGYIYI